MSRRMTIVTWLLIGVVCVLAVKECRENEARRARYAQEEQYMDRWEPGYIPKWRTPPTDAEILDMLKEVDRGR